MGYHESDATENDLEHMLQSNCGAMEYSYWEPFGIETELCVSEAAIHRGSSMRMNDARMSSTQPVLEITFDGRRCPIIKEVWVR